jgi:hypothetical protein
LERRNAALAEVRNEKKRKKLLRDAERKIKKKPKIEHVVGEPHVDSDDEEDDDDDVELAEALKARKQEKLLKDAERKREQKSKIEHGIRGPNIDSDDDDDDGKGSDKEEQDEEEDPQITSRIGTDTA